MGRKSKYYWIVTFADRTTYRVDVARGAREAATAACAQRNRFDCVAVDRFVTGDSGMIHKRWTFKNRPAPPPMPACAYEAEPEPTQTAPAERKRFHRIVVEDE